MQRRDLLAHPRHHGQAQLARLVGDDGGAELDDRDGHAAGNATAGSTIPAPAGAQSEAIPGKMRSVELDLLVIGSGPSGQKAAIQAAKLGKRVAVAERRDRLGGVSIHTGTIPSKTLREAVLDQLAERPLDVLDPTRMEETERAVLQTLMDRTAHVIAAETAVVREQFRRNMVGWLPGEARFEDDHTVLIEGSDEQIRAERIVIARRHAPGAAGRPSPSTTARSSTPTGCSGSTGACRAP